jgi:hypothetical protein
MKERVSNMKSSLSILALILTSLVTAHAQLQTLPVENFEIAPGTKAKTIDRAVQEKIKQSIQDNLKDWRLESVLETKESSSSTMIWANGEHRMIVDVSYLSSAQEAGKQLRFNLATIQMPRYKPFDNLGDEAYLIKSDGPIMFRKAEMVVTVCGCPAPFEIVERFARRISTVKDADK